MISGNPLFSVCVPAYNRAKYLPELLNSVLDQDLLDFEVIVCEDRSPERDEISAIIREYQTRFPKKITYYENEENLGYDANIRRLVQMATGQFCFFMGNDDIMSPGALRHVHQILQRHSNVGVILRGYAWFDQRPDQISQEIRYFDRETEIPAGEDSIAICFRRSGVISGFIVDRQTAFTAATTKFDGSLYYQMHLAAAALCHKCAVVTPEILVLCRNSEAPDFGHSRKERGLYTPGRYTPNARLNMISGALNIIRNIRDTAGIDVVDRVQRDYANYFYLCIRDQLNLPLREYWCLYREFGKMGFDRYLMFHIYCVASYCLGQKLCDRLIKTIRRAIGRSPQWGFQQGDQGESRSGG